MLLPTSQMRALRELRAAVDRRGFAEVEQLPFARTPGDPAKPGGVFVAAGRTQPTRLEAGAPSRAIRVPRT